MAFIVRSQFGLSFSKEESSYFYTFDFSQKASSLASRVALIGSRRSITRDLSRPRNKTIESTTRREGKAVAWMPFYSRDSVMVHYVSQLYTNKDSVGDPRGAENTTVSR